MRNDEKLYTVAQATKKLLVSHSTIYQWLTDGSLKGYKVGRGWRIKGHDLRTFFEPIPPNDVDALTEHLRVALNTYIHGAGFTYPDLREALHQLEELVRKAEDEPSD